MFNGGRLIRCLEVKIKMYGLRVMLHGHNPMYLFPFHTHGHQKKWLTATDHFWTTRCPPHVLLMYKLFLA